MAVVGYKSGTLAINICLSFNVVVVFSPTYFCFRHASTCTDKLLGDFHIGEVFGALPCFELGRRWRFRRDRDGEGDGYGERDGDGERDEGRRRYLTEDGDIAINNKQSSLRH